MTKSTEDTFMGDVVAFTGTRYGMTLPQRTSFKQVMREIAPNVDIFQHGDCVGADADAHAMVLAYHKDIRVHLWPCDLPGMRANCEGGHHTHPIKKPLARNRTMVRNASVVVACPPTRDEQLRGGTWSTIRYARKMKRKLYIITPEGTTQYWKFQSR